MQKIEGFDFSKCLSGRIKYYNPETLTDNELCQLLEYTTRQTRKRDILIGPLGKECGTGLHILTKHNKKPKRINLSPNAENLASLAGLDTSGIEERYRIAAEHGKVSIGYNTKHMAVGVYFPLEDFDFTVNLFRWHKDGIGGGIRLETKDYYRIFSIPDFRECDLDMNCLYRLKTTVKTVAQNINRI